MHRGLLFLLGISLFPVARAGGQTLQPQNIRFDGAPDYTDAELLTASSLKKGAKYTSQDLDEHAHALMTTGIFGQVGYKFDGVSLVFMLSEAPEVYPIVLDNLPLDTGQGLDAQLRQRVPLFHGKAPADGTVFDGLQHALEAMLADEGIHAPVSGDAIGNRQTHTVTAIKFSIAAPPVTVGALRLEGVSDPLQAKIRRVAQRAGSPFDSQKTANQLQSLFESFYRNEGYAAARIHVARGADAETTPDAIRVPFTISVEEGKVYKLGSIRFTTAIPLHTDQGGNAPLRATPESQTLGATLGMALRRFRSKGYIDCELKAHPELDEAAGVANYTVDADSGPQYHLAFVKFENVNDDLRGLLMRSWQMLPGDPFDEEYVSTFMNKSRFSDPALTRALTGMKASYDVHADTDTHEVNLVIRLEKQ